MKFNLKPNRKTRFTRKCISEAIMILLQDTPFEKLKISEIIIKAGISRMTFYKYYHTPKAALIDYLQIIISEYVESTNAEEDRKSFRSYEHILDAINFFDQYREFFLIMAKNGLHSILLDGVNQFMESYIETSENVTIYEIYAYSGALFNTFLNWECNGRKDSAEEVAKHIYQLYGKK